MDRKRVRYERVGRKAKPTNVVEIYPTATGGRRASDRTVGRSSSEDREPRAIRCYQCGYPLEDYGEISNCPFCNSDNFLGRSL